MTTYDSSSDPNAPQPPDMKPGDRWRSYDADYVMEEDGTLSSAVRLDAEAAGIRFVDCYMSEGQYDQWKQEQVSLDEHHQHVDHDASRWGYR